MEQDNSHNSYSSQSVNVMPKFHTIHPAFKV